MNKIPQLFSPAAYIHDSEINQDAIERLISDLNIGGLTFFHSRHSAAANFEKRQETLQYENTLEKLVELINRFQKISEIPLLISIDAEYGLTMRVEKTPQYPYAITLGELPIEEVGLVEQVGFRIGQDLKACGIHLNFAPVVDVNTNPNNPVIGYRSFGNNPEKVKLFSNAYYKGMQNAGIEGCYKHFPGHGDTDVDSHLGLPIINKSRAELYKEELFPFIDGVQNQINMIMVGHLAVPALTNGEIIPASLSKQIITDLLKEELGFKGIVVSDALNMKSVASMYPEKGKLEWLAFEAGNDILCFAENINEGVAYINKHSDPLYIEKAVAKIAELKKNLGLNTQPITTPFFNWESHREFTRKLSKHFIETLYEDKSKISSGLDYSRWAKASLYAPAKNHFLNGIPQIQNEYVLTQSKIEELLSKITIDTILISLFVPSAKPINNFGLELSLLEKIGELAASKHCILYFFGHRYALDLLPNRKSFTQIVIAHQDFPETQKEAAYHFKKHFE